MTQLLTSKEAAAELGISKSTLHRHTKSGQIKASSTPSGHKRYSAEELQRFQAPPDPTQSISRLVPGGGSWLVNPVQQFTGIYRGGKNYYVPSDTAIRESRENARRMWNNLTIREALQSRLWAAAEQQGHVECEDKHDKRQLAVASEIQQVIDNIPDFLKLKYCLLKSRFFGVYGAQLQYRFDAKRKIYVQAWSPVHGDSIIFKQDSDDIAIYTTVGGGPGVKKVTTEAGYIGRAHLLEDGREIYFDEKGMPYQKVGFNERQAFILMSYDPDPSDFLDPRGAGGVKGLGIRSTIYPTWYASQEILGNLVEWIERVGTGITFYKFIRGNQQSYNQAKELAESASNQGVMLVPVDPEMNGGKPLEGVERIEPSAVGLENMVKVIEDIFNSQIRRFIVGQDSTSRPANLGLGSKIAEVHESTFSRIIAFDCQDLAQCLSTQLVDVIHEWNHPNDLDFKCRYIVDADSSDVDKQMGAIKSAYEIGVSFDEDEVRQLTGMSKPDLDASILKKAPEQHKQHQEQTSEDGSEDQAETAASGELAQTVGGLQAIASLQSQFYEGKIPQAAAVNNVVLLFGFTQDQAESLFPDIHPEKLTEDEGMGAPAEELFPEEEEPTLFRYAGFTGKRKDKIGRETCWQDGKRVPCPDEDEDKKGKPKKAAPQTEATKGLQEVADEMAPEVEAAVKKDSKLKDFANKVFKKVSDLAKTLHVNELPAWAMEHCDIYLWENALNAQRAGSVITVKAAVFATVKAWSLIRGLVGKKKESMMRFAKDDNVAETLHKFFSEIGKLCEFPVPSLDEINEQIKSKKFAKEDDSKTKLLAILEVLSREDLSEEQRQAAADAVLGGD